MRETILSNNEKSFVEKSILEGLRVDKRNLNEFRNLGLFFGQDVGSVICTLGATKVFAQVSCELSSPRTSRPNEGTIFINVEMGPMAAPHLEVGFPLSDSCIQINRILERTLRESRCVDLESLCIIAEEKVWNLRVDIAVLNHEGNVMDCSCIAAVAALAHFKRPDVTTTGDGEFIIHSPAEKDLVPIVLHHYPICVTYALFDDGKIPVADPTALEERVSEASLVLAVNSYKELCCMNLTGVSLTSPHLILRCSEMAAERSRRIVEFIKSILEEDEAQRAKGNLPKGFAESIALSNLPSNFHNEEIVEKIEQPEIVGIAESSSHGETSDDEVKIIDDNTVTSGKWIEVTSEDEDSSSDEEMPEQTNTRTSQDAPKTEKKLHSNESSEEEKTIVLK
ncbi:CLUMA_CG002121, isoform A [Clunio marinus]|uniref:Exosome complex component RRP45 n=1 Tax=Clunio marinus TaxID=568069 RepID=A0A1J1HJX3_9DIPT|nr:CLUMA_CG002121, isoform A [Clunio marinus]